MQINKIGLGTVQFGLDYGISNNSGKTSSEEVTRILKFAKEKGIDTIDTAQAYGDSENVLGMNDLKGFKIVTKFIKGDKSVLSIVNSSLEKLKQQELYGLLVHSPQEVLQNEKVWNELIGLKNIGLVKKIGFSFNDPNEVEKCLQKKMIPDVIQVPYNYFDSRFEKHFPQLKDLGCEIHTRSTFLQGLFFLSEEILKSKFMQVAKMIIDLQNQFNSHLSKGLINFVMNNKYIDKVVLGVNSYDQLQENLTIDNTQFDLPKINHLIPDEILIPSKWKN